ncbi:MAG: acyl-[acyl-carrier-protein] thioesterase [Balneolaceae bacterium]|nr:acyl-[acyl-carrier-protein] thioesterase [Balneolaceae bacterium]MBO6547780.1 acyl-[acyl-carrier-protein] thioesterase [Balneolaceae bacterium]MBO6648291.1 acyl-[acyl-carrier-protein] thioesterase [Balneolaceae bacterium]
MSETHTFYTEQFTIRANEVDTSGNTTLKAICDFFQEVAGNNAKELHFDITDLQEQDLTWVLHRMDIQIKRFPKWRETITIETWPAAGDALRAYRNYRILDEDGVELGCCLSYWMMINMTTRRPVRMPKEVLETRLAKRNHVLEVKSNRISPISEFHKTKEFSVRRSDLDMNMHVNNAMYIDWMQECLSLEESKNVSRFDIIYMRESLEGDIISASVEQAESGIKKLQLINQDEKTIALAEVNFGAD